MRIENRNGGKDAWKRVDIGHKSYGVQDDRVWSIARGGFGMPDLAAGPVDDPEERAEILNLVQKHPIDKNP